MGKWEVGSKDVSKMAVIPLTSRGDVIRSDI
jgi:hypothetical protein